MSKGTESKDSQLPTARLDTATAKNSVPLTTRLAIEIPKPKDWQAFQRNCVLLFRAELNDPHAQEYGRGGQAQHGIDILARRDGRDDHFVGVQCRLITKPMKEAKIMADARAALKLEAGLKELIFATTAPDDSGASDAAVSVTRALKTEGHDVKVVVYGWGQLQILIAPHDVAYNVFHPSAVASAALQATGPGPGGGDSAASIAEHVVEQLRGAGLTVVAPTGGVAVSTDEDIALHARIDTFRDLFKERQEPLLAEKGLLSLLETEVLSGKPWARYRIETNLGSIAIELGREAEAAERFDAAHAIRPDNPNALANLALARTIQGRFEEAMTAAHAALTGKPRANHAVSYLLQAAARAAWDGEPESLIPEDLVGTAQADIGLAEFLRQREIPGWAERTLEIARRHQDAPEFKRIRAIAVLSLAIDEGATVFDGRGTFTPAELNTAADDMKALAEHCLAVGFADAHDLTAYLNNAAVLLRLCGRHKESEALLERGLPGVGNEPQLRRLLALARVEQGLNAEAIATLAGDADPENQILSAELQASNEDPTGALESVVALDPAHLPVRLQLLRWRLIGELALRLGHYGQVAAAVAELRALDPHDLAASLLEIRADRKTVEDHEVLRERLRVLAASVPGNMISRYVLAEELRNQQMPEEASRLLDDHVNLSRPSPTTLLYLESLAAARRDETFRAALAQAAPEVQDNPATLWTVAAHAWNLGDLAAASSAIEALLLQKPNDPRARLLKIEILVRQDRSVELLAELEKPVEKLAWWRPEHQFRIASLLGHFGFAERAAELAYRLFLQHRDLSRAWMTLSMLVLEEGSGGDDRPGRWGVGDVGHDVAIDLRYDDGTELFFVVEPDEVLRKLDPESWEPEHPLVRAVAGLCVGAKFVGPDGRKGVVRQIRHKYVARLHYVLEHHETRFPEIMGFRRVTVDLEQPGGLDALIEQVKARHDWIQEEENRYLNGPWPIGVLAHRVGVDTIEVAAGLASHDVQLKVAAGNLPEREAADQAVRLNRRSGCVLDLLAFWTAWRLDALDAVRSTCGPIHLAQSLLDRLRARREQFERSAHDGLRNLGYENGKLRMREISAELICGFRDEVDRAIAWAEANAIVLPVVAGDDLPVALREHLRSGRSDVFDSLILARRTDLLFVTDDLPMREFDRMLRGEASAWLHVVFGVALDWKHIGFDRYVRWSANLVDAGHNYLGVSAHMLAHAARMDAETGTAPGTLFKTISTMIGGRTAERNSHVNAVLGCLRELWADHTTIGFRQPVTGHLLRQLVRERTDDYIVILQTVLKRVHDLPALARYVHGWLRGHLLAEAVLSSRR